MLHSKLTQKDLTPQQRKFVISLQKNGTHYCTGSSEKRVFKKMSEMGITELVNGGNGTNAYQLTENWQDAYIDPNPYLTKSPESASATAGKSNGKIVRPPAVYSNVSRDQWIDRILGNSTFA